MTGHYQLPVAAIAHVYLRIRGRLDISGVLTRRWLNLGVGFMMSVEQTFNEAISLATEEWSRTPSAHHEGWSDSFGEGNRLALSCSRLKAVDDTNRKLLHDAFQVAPAW